MALALVFRLGLLFLIVFTIGLMGRTRRIGFWKAVVLSIVLTPLGGFLVAVASGPKPVMAPKKKTQKYSSQGAPTSQSSQLSGSTQGSGQLRQPQA